MRRSRYLRGRLELSVASNRILRLASAWRRSIGWLGVRRVPLVATGQRRLIAQVEVVLLLEATLVR